MNNERTKSLYGLALYLLIYVLGAFIIQFIIGYVISNIYEISFATLITTYPFNHEINSKMYIASLNFLTYTNLFLFIAFFIGLIALYKDELWLSIKEFKNKIIKNISFIIGGFLLLYSTSLLINKLASMNGIDESSNQKLIEAMFNNNGIIPVFLSVVVLAPFVEELVYRKCICGICQNRWLFYIATTVIFGFIHMSGTPIESPLQWMLTFLPYATSGLILGVCYERTSNIYVSTSVHILNNLIGFIILCL